MKKILLGLFTLFIFSASVKGQIIVGDTSVCSGSFEVYSVSPGAATYTWSVTGGNIQSGGSTNVATIQWGPSGSGTITVTQTGPPLIYVLNVQINPRPVPSITHPPYPTCPVQQGNGSPNAPDGRNNCEKVCKGATVVYSTALNPGSTYQWFCSGGTTVSVLLNTATITWDTTAFGSLLVIETNQYGCRDSARICIEKVNLPVALFSHNANACLNVNVSFTNLSVGNNTYQWYFGDGGSSTQVNPVHSYTSPGVYTITLIAINSCFCKDTFQSSITINSLPGPDISCPATVCAFDTATYSTPSSPGCTYNWFANGGTIVSGQGTPNVAVAWGAGQTGVLGLYITGCGGQCNDTTFIQVPIVPANGVISGPSKVCAGECAVFSLPRFSGAGYTWSLSNPACGGVLSDTVCCEQVEVCYLNPFIFCNDTLTVTYYDSFLGCGGTAKKVIRVRPRLSIFGSTTLCSATPATFTAFGGGPVVCTWSVSPSGPSILPGGPSSSITVNWNNLTGPFTITATPLPPGQVCDDSAQAFLNVIQSPPAPVITGDTLVCPGSSKQYCAVSTNTVNWIITGGTPSSAVGNCITVNWGSIPPFVVRAYEQSNTAPFCTGDTTVQNITPLLGVPIPVISPSGAVCANSTNGFSCVTPYPGGAVYTWSTVPANSGSVISGQGTSSAQIQWGNNAPQNVTVVLSVSVCNQTVSGQQALTLNPAPVISVAQLGPLCAGGSAQISGSGASTYQWSGPGGFSATGTPVTITQNGLYQVTATGTNGCTALSQINVPLVSGPQASISTADFTSYCIGTSFAVNICALGNPAYTYQWSNGPTTQCVAVSTAGTFVVTVTDNSNGCTALSNSIIVAVDSCNGGGPGSGGPCVPLGSVSFTQTSCNPVYFTNTSVNAFNYNWTFGDTGSSNLANPVHQYNQAGFYLVTLTALVPSVNGIDTCLVRDTAHIKVPLAARFDHAANCYNDPVCFTDKSTYTAGNNITSWYWDFGDGNNSSLQNPCHVYGVGGTYLVTLIVSSGVCNDTITDSVTVRPAPVAAFTKPAVFCVNTPVSYTDLSFAAINYWQWRFGDGGSSLNQNPTHTFSLPGVYSDTLVVKDIYGCYDTTVQSITIVPPAISGNITALPDTVVCAGNFITLIAPTCGTCTYLWSTGWTSDTLQVNNTGIFVVTVTDNNGCPYVTSISVLVNNAPPAVIQNTGDDELCVGESTTLQVVNNVNWLYNWISNDPSVNGQTANSVFVFGSVPGLYNYQVVVTDTTTGCADTSLIYLITVHPLPVPPIITPLGSTTICAGDTVVLVGFHPDPTVNYLWNTGWTDDTLSVTKNGCYNLVVTDTNGCKNNSSQCVTVNPLPDLCTFYEGCVDTCSPFLIMGPAGAASYLWLFNGVSTGVTSQNYTATASGAYSVIVTNSFGCVDTTGDLNLNLYPCPDDSLCADIVIDSTACINGNHVIYYHVINNSNVVVNQVVLQILAPFLNVAYAPNANNINIPPAGNSGPLSATLFNANNGDYICFRAHLSAFDSTGKEILCCYSDTDCVTMPACKDTFPPGCYLQFEDSICQGQTATFVYNGNPAGLTFTWQFPGGTPSLAGGPGPHVITYSTTGCFPVICIINNNLPGTIDCVDSICVYPPPIATITQSGGMLIAGPAGCTYQWHQGFPNGPGINGAVNQFYQPQVSDFYCVVVSKGAGCTDTACIDFIETNITSMDENHWEIFPNPNSGSFTLRLEGMIYNAVELSVTNTLGEVVDRRIFTVPHSNGNFLIENSLLSSGVYFVSLKTGSGTSVRKMIVK